MTEAQFAIDIVAQGWLSGCPPEEDYCSHGKIALRIGDVWVERGEDEWGISVSALALLRTLGSDHSADHPVADRLVFDGCATLLMIGCPIGIDWSVTHRCGSVRLADVVRYDTTSESEATRFPDLAAEVPFEEYRRQVVAFARKAKKLFAGAVKSFGADWDRKHYEGFWAEFDELLASHGESS